MGSHLSVRYFLMMFVVVRTYRTDTTLVPVVVFYALVHSGTLHTYVPGVYVNAQQ